jgi:GT2 family glycosyltransferase
VRAPLRVAVLMTVHNRVATTARCLAALDRAAAAAGINLVRVIVDDGSTDGTPALLRRLRRDEDVIVTGPGSLYWAGGMRAAFSALPSCEPFDHVLLLNDDAVLYEDSLRCLLSTPGLERDSLIVGRFVDPTTGAATYGGYRRHSRWRPLTFVQEHEPLSSVHAMNANAVLVTREANSRLGGFPDRYTHSLADFDYALRANEAGLKVLLSLDVVGECPRNPATGSWQDRTLPRQVRLRKMRSPKGLPPREWTAFCWRHGRFLGLPYIFSPWIRIFATPRRRAAGDA